MRPEAPARCYTAHYYIALHCATLCYIALHTHSTILHCTPCVQHCVCIAQHSNAQHCTTLYYIVLHYTALHTADYGRLVVSKTVFFEIMQISGKSLTFALWYSIVYISCLLHVKIPQEYKTSLLNITMLNSLFDQCRSVLCAVIDLWWWWASKAAEFCLFIFVFCLFSLGLFVFSCTVIDMWWQRLSKAAAWPTTTDSSLIFPPLCIECIPTLTRCIVSIHFRKEGCFGKYIPRGPRAFPRAVILHPEGNRKNPNALPREYIG